MDINLFDYRLPEDLIAQFPVENRDESKLLVVNRNENSVDHKHFYDIVDYLNPGDCLVLNNSKVIHARLVGIKEKTGATIEVFLIKKADNPAVSGDSRTFETENSEGADDGTAGISADIWEAMIKPAKRLKKGDMVAFSPDFKCEMLGQSDDGLRLVKFHYEGIFMERLAELGKMPLPPYIKRVADNNDDGRYQTVYSKIDGSVAAPTAGLHFTEALLKKIENKGIKIAYLTLHVGIGTFRPVKVSNIEDHLMHKETYHVSEAAAGIINGARNSGGKIVCVGTTSVRTLESVSDDRGRVHGGTGETDIFIYPGYKFKGADSLITNFHLPKSTLMMLISAFYDREKILEIYKTAIDNNYRFFSYGDSMLIL